MQLKFFKVIFCIISLFCISLISCDKDEVEQQIPYEELWEVDLKSYFDQNIGFHEIISLSNGNILAVVSMDELNLLELNGTTGELIFQTEVSNNDFRNLTIQSDGLVILQSYSISEETFYLQSYEPVTHEITDLASFHVDSLEDPTGTIKVVYSNNKIYSYNWNLARVEGDTYVASWDIGGELINRTILESSVDYEIAQIYVSENNEIIYLSHYKKLIPGQIEALDEYRSTYGLGKLSSSGDLLWHFHINRESTSTPRLVFGQLEELFVIYRDSVRNYSPHGDLLWNVPYQDLGYLLHKNGFSVGPGTSLTDGSIIYPMETGPRENLLIKITNDGEFTWVHEVCDEDEDINCGYHSVIQLDGDNILFSTWNGHLTMFTYSGLE